MKGSTPVAGDDLRLSCPCLLHPQIATHGDICVDRWIDGVDPRQEPPRVFNGRDFPASKQDESFGQRVGRQPEPRESLPT